MAGNRMICHCKQVDYITIRKAMIEGARTIEEIKEKQEQVQAVVAALKLLKKF